MSGDDILRRHLREWADEAGDMARGHFRRTGPLAFKTGREAVTAADRAIETMLRERIAGAYPDDLVVGEEYGGPAPGTDLAGRRVWHLDPIDGTLNFALGLPDFCTSLAAIRDDRVEAACVQQPLVGDTFLALRGGGATLNGVALRVSDRAPLAEAVISAQFKKDGVIVSRPELLQAVFRRPLKVRKAGAIALEMAWVAAGFLDAMVAGFRDTIQTWDVGAGLLLVGWLLGRRRG